MMWCIRPKLSPAGQLPDSSSSAARAPTAVNWSFMEAHVASSVMDISSLKSTWIFASLAVFSSSREVASRVLSRLMFKPTR